MKRFTAACLFLLALTVFFEPAFSESQHDSVTSTEKLELKYVNAALQNGNIDTNPEDLKACHKQVSSPNSKYLGNTVSTTYSVNSKSLIMSASSSLPSPDSTQPLELTIPLSPLGLQGKYAFGAFNPAELQSTSVLFSVDTSFKNPQSSILVINNNQKFNCLVSSSSKPFQGNIKSKYKVQK